MPKAILTVGVSASGKSTWAKQFVADNPGWVIVCRDDIRSSQGFPPLGNKEQEKVVTTLQRAHIEAAFLDGFNVIVADTNLNKDVRNSLVKYLHKHQADVEFKVLDVSLEEAIRRDANRQATVGENVIRKQYDRYRNLPELPPVPAEKFEGYQHQGWPHRYKTFVFDLDGTLADGLVHRSPYDYSNVIADDPIDDVVYVLNTLSNSGLDVVFVSGRKEECREQTENWIRTHTVIEDPILYMRKTGDDRADWVVKSEIYDREIIPIYDIMGVFDDRDQVVRHLRTRGITVFQVAPGRF